MKEHPDKHIRAAIDYTLVQVWIFHPGGKSAHCFGRLICGMAHHPEYMMSIWSTPAVPINHARQLIRMVDRCQPPTANKIHHQKDLTMALYNFTLTLSGVTVHTEGLEDALHTAGCADALVCFYGTAVYLEFARESDSLERAILSAIADIESAPALNARVESVDSALVGLSDIAELAGLTRQAIALLKDGARGSGQFPGPVQRVKGNSPLWRWKTVVRWLVMEGRLAEDSPLVAHAAVLDNLNLALQLRATPESKTVLRYLRGLENQRQASPTVG
ncbi:hypothetical protein AI2711V1_1396 [Raoultella ornithinolytica]|nr:hypothetical protein AI2711V1_1396 [Raoultella ornithinolytica]CAH3411882.1 hypothetical protein AI2711V1_1396 [Raoultella ornithinolytica]